MLLLGGWLVYGDWQTRGWPIADGRVISSRVVRSNRVSDYLADIRFEYEVGGRRYQGDRRAVRWGRIRSRFESRARDVVARYPVGSAVSVSYDPQNPSYAMIEPGVSFGSVILLIIGVGFVGIAAIFARESLAA